MFVLQSGYVRNPSRIAQHLPASHRAVRLTHTVELAARLCKRLSG
jgi:hypothetical protein